MLEVYWTVKICNNLRCLPCLQRRVLKVFWSSQGVLQKIWKAWELQFPIFSKAMFHSDFTVPVFVSRFAILDWKLEEICNLNIKTRKILTITRKFHTGCVYFRQMSRDRGIRSVQTDFELPHHSTCKVVTKDMSTSNV